MVTEDLAISLTVLRAIRRLSQGELGEAAGVTASAISDYERAKVDPQTQTLGRLLHAMGFPLAALDQTQEFILRIRAQGSLEPRGEGAERPAAAELRGLRVEIAQVALEGGRFATRLFLLLLAIVLRPHERQEE